MPNNATAETVLAHFEQRWEELLQTISPASAQDPRFRAPMRCVYLGAGLALLSAGVASLDRAQTQRLADAWAAEALEMLRRFLESKKGPVE